MKDLRTSSTALARSAGDFGFFSKVEFVLPEVVAYKVGVRVDFPVLFMEVRWMPSVPEVRSKDELPSRIT
jgi:hypothetical protein